MPDTYLLDKYTSIEKQHLIFKKLDRVYESEFPDGYEMLHTVCCLIIFEYLKV